MSNKQDIINIYLDWFNNFISLELFAEYYEITYTQAQTLISLGHSLHEDNVAFLKNIEQG